MRCEGCKHYLKGGSACGLCYCYDRFEPKDYPPYLDYPKERKPKTNADRIRAMTDEELAQYMGDVQTWGGCPNHGARNCTENCADCWLDWLKQEVTEHDDA